ncbi:hypothetical protein QTP88_015018 [Uroleucon formosanum]
MSPTCSHRPTPSFALRRSRLRYSYNVIVTPAENVSFPCKIESNRIFTISATGLFFLVVYIIQLRDSLARNDKRKKKKVLNRILSNRREKKVFSSLQTITARSICTNRMSFRKIVCLGRESCKNPY